MRQYSAWHVLSPQMLTIVRVVRRSSLLKRAIPIRRKDIRK